MSVLPTDFTNFHRTVDNMFRDFASAIGGTTSRQGAAIGLHGNPLVRTDIFDEGNLYKIWLDLPGCNKNNVKLQMNAGNELSVKVEKIEVPREELEKYVVMQRPHGNLERRIQLPDEVKLEELTAHMEDGVLLLQIPKKAEALLRKEIQIQ